MAGSDKGDSENSLKEAEGDSTYSKDAEKKKEEGDNIEKRSPEKEKKSRRRRDESRGSGGGRDRSKSRKRSRSRRRRSHSSSSSSESTSDDSSISSGRRKRKRKKSERRKHRSSRRHKKRSRSFSSSSSSSSDEKSRERRKRRRARSKEKPKVNTESSKTAKTKLVPNAKLLHKLSARGETLEEREMRRAKKRAERIASTFGYTPEDNPFNDPNLHDTFSWKKKDQQQQQQRGGEGTSQQTQQQPKKSRKEEQEHILEEISKVRQRRIDREAQQDALEQQRAQEARLRELEHFDAWTASEEQFHLAQQRQRSAIRLLEQREKPIDVLAKNLLLFGTANEQEEAGFRVKYKERYDALKELDRTLEAELLEPHLLLRDLKLIELQELLHDIDEYRSLEREVALAEEKKRREEGTLNDSPALDDNIVLRYWDNLYLVCRNEIHYINTGGHSNNEEKSPKAPKAIMMEEIQALFHNKTTEELKNMKQEIIAKLQNKQSSQNGPTEDDSYWQTVLAQLEIHQAKEELSDIHNRMLARQLEKLEKKKEALHRHLEDHDGDKKRDNDDDNDNQPDTAQDGDHNDGETNTPMLPIGVEPDFGNLEEALGLSAEVDVATNPGSDSAAAWTDKYRPRKPRYFNRVKTGYDWNKYNQTHYDHDNPPPKIVQGYKFNIFYPDLIDKRQTPTFVLEPADTKEFCIIRFKAGPPYEDVAFQIINREWNRARKRGYRCVFERGVLSLYFNFKTHWYRR